MPVAQGEIQSVQRALQLLSAFTPEQAEWSVSDLARKTGLHKSVVTRLMATMARAGFVIQDDQRKTYTIGPQVFAVGSVYGPYTILDRLARPVLHDLAATCGHTCALGIPSGPEFLYLLVVESPRSTPIRVNIEVGKRRPLHAAAIGKVLLAQLPREKVCELLGDGPLAKLTPHTVDSVAQLLPELDEVRRTGVAFSRQESALGVGAVAAGISNDRGQCVAGINVAYPFHLVSPQEADQIVESTLTAARRISRQIGGLTL